MLERYILTELSNAFFIAEAFMGLYFEKQS